MDIAVSELFNLERLKEYKIHFAVWNGEVEPLDVFVRNREEWKGWNSWRNRRNDFSRRYIFINLTNGFSAEYLRSLGVVLNRIRSPWSIGTKSMLDDCSFITKDQEFGAALFIWRNISNT